MKKIFTSFNLTVTFVFVTFIAHSQWSSNPAINVAVCTIASGKQVDPRILPDEKGGAFIMWKDYRAGLPDVYIQRVDKNGFVKWTIDGIGVCTDPADQSTPAMCTDMNGGCIVAWSDWRSGIERDLYAQRIDSNGVALWTTNGAVVANKPEREHNERICSDGANGAIVSWEQQSGGWDVWCQRIDANGNVVWTPGGLPVTLAAGSRVNGRLQEDGKNGCYIVWQDFRNGIDYDIYAQHVSSTGALLWGASGLDIAIVTGTQNNPKIDPDPLSGGFYCSWVDGRFVTKYDIYAQRVDSAGNIMWAANGNPVVVQPGTQSAQDICSDASINGLIVTWKDDRFGNFDIYAQRLDSAGNPQWGPSGIIVCNSVYNQLNPNIIPDFSGGAIIAFADSSLGNFDIRAQRINLSGSLLWAASGALVGNAVGDQTNVKHTDDKSGGAIFTFMDKRSGTNHIYAHHLYANGTTVNGIEEWTALNNASVSPNPFSEGFILTLESKTDEPLYIFAYDLVGNYIAEMSLTNGLRINGKQTLQFAPSKEMADGVYFLTLRKGNASTTVKLIKVD